MDVRKLLAGQNWPRAIEAAIESSDFFVACFSGNPVRQKGGFQSELRYALDCARQVPLDEIYIVPVRLDDCAVPRTIQHELQYIDLFPDWDAGMKRLLTMLRREVDRRRVAPALLAEEPNQGCATMPNSGLLFLRKRRTPPLSQPVPLRRAVAVRRGFSGLRGDLGLHAG